MANLAPVPDNLTDEQVLMLPELWSTVFARCWDRENIRLADSVAIIRPRPIGFLRYWRALQFARCNTIIAVETVPRRMERLKTIRANFVIALSKKWNPVKE